MSLTPTPDNTPNRRSVLKTGAWSVPVIATAIAAPAATASTCRPVNASVTATWTSVTPGTPFFNDTLTGAPWASRSNRSTDYGDVRSSVNYRNNGPDAIPAGTLLVEIIAPSLPGLVSSSVTPYTNLETTFMFPGNWELVSTTLIDAPAVDSGGATNVRNRWYAHTYRFLPALPANASTTPVYTRLVPNSVRPTRASYGSNWPNVLSNNSRNWAHYFGTIIRFPTCNPATGATTTVTSTMSQSEVWGIYYPAGTARMSVSAESRSADDAALPALQGEPGAFAASE